MKYCRAIYKALVRVAPELARRTFVENRGFYHPIAASLIEKVSFAQAPTLQDIGL